MACKKTVLLSFLFIFVVNVCSREIDDIWNISEEEDVELERQLKILNKPPVKTFQSSSGIIYDCIDMYKQPAFDHPLLKNHKLQLRPSSHPKGVEKSRVRRENSIHRKNTTCPSGTVLIRRTQKKDLIYFRHLEKSMKRHVADIRPQTNIDSGSHYAIMQTDIGEFYGSRATLTVHRLSGLTLEQGAISQIWIIGGAEGDESKINTVQAGWQVNPSVNDGSPGTFLATRWTSDGYKNGCFNFLCVGFVARSPDFGPGSEITELSVPGGIQRYIDLLIFKDRSTGNWWLAYGEDKQEVGYWPKELFNNLDKATAVDWGGAVSSPLNQPSPPMGSGYLPYHGKNMTAYFTNIKLINEKNEMYDPQDNEVSLATDLENYYRIEGNYQSGDPDGYQFRYGGPGGYKG